eukprot:INCI10426.3.p1 GENE.INCI10426.3~~INCI10426.3.p1  ORF type:complete len:2285 (-),score=373.91 INCI10426.3:38-6892(-)
MCVGGHLRSCTSKCCTLDGQQIHLLSLASVKLLHSSVSWAGRGFGLRSRLKMLEWKRVASVGQLLTVLTLTTTSTQQLEIMSGWSNYKRHGRRKKSKQKSSDGSAGRAGGPSPSLNVEKARLHRGGGGGDGRSRIKKNIESKKDASSSKPQAVPGKVPTESTRASSPGSSGDLQFVPVKRIEIPLEDICLEDELAESQRTPSFHAAGGLPPRSAAGIRAQAARNAAREQAAGAAAAIQAQVHECIELCCLSEDCTLFACKLGQPFQRLVLVEINLRSTVEPAVATERCKSRISHLTLHPSASFKHATSNWPTLCTSTRTQLRFWTRAHASLSSMRPLEQVRDSLAHCWLSFAAPGSKPQAFVANATARAENSSSPDEGPIAHSTPPGGSNPADGDAASVAESTRPRGPSFSMNSHRGPNSADSLSKTPTLATSIVQILTSGPGEPKIVFELPNAFSFKPHVPTKGGVKGMVPHKQPVKIMSGRTTGPALPRVGSAGTPSSECKDSGSCECEAIQFMSSSDNVLAIYGTMGTLAVFKFVVKKSSPAEVANGDHADCATSTSLSAPVSKSGTAPGQSTSAGAKQDGSSDKNAHMPRQRLFQQGDAREEGPFFHCSCYIGVGQLLRVACVFNSRFAPDLRLPRSPLTFLQLSPDKTMLLLHTEQRVAKLLRVAQSPEKDKQMRSKGLSVTRSSYVAPRFEHRLGRRSVFGADSWTSGSLQGASLAKTAPYVVTLSLEPPDGETVDVLDDDDLENFDFGNIGQHQRNASRDSTGTADAPKHAGSPTSALQRNQLAVDDNCPVRLWDYLTGERPISYRPAVRLSMPSSHEPTSYGDTLQSTGAASSGALDSVATTVVDDDPFREGTEPISVRSLAVHPSGLQVVMGCRQGIKILSRVYTVLADNLTLLYEVDSTPKTLVAEVERQAAIAEAAMSDKASANEASSKANPAQNPTKPSDKARADNAPLDLHSEGAKMFFYIQVAFSEGGQMWCSASYDTVKVYETWAAFGCSRPSLVISFDLRCAQLAWGLNDCALVAVETNPLLHLTTDRSPASEEAQEKAIPRLLSRRVSSGGLAGPVAAAAAAAAATLASVRELLDDYATDAGRAVVWLASNPKTIKVLDQLKLKSLDLFNTSQMILLTSTKAFRRAGTSGNIQAVFDTDEQNDGDSASRHSSQRWTRSASSKNRPASAQQRQAANVAFRGVGFKAQMQALAALNIATYTCASISYNDVCLVNDDYTPRALLNPGLAMAAASAAAGHSDYEQTDPGEADTLNHRRAATSSAPGFGAPAAGSSLVGVGVATDTGDGLMVGRLPRTNSEGVGELPSDQNAHHSVSGQAFGEGNVHPSIRNDGHSSIISWIKLVGVHPVPPPPKLSKSTQSAGDAESSNKNPFDAVFSSIDNDGKRPAVPVADEKPKAMRTKIRMFRVGGHRQVTQLIARKHCLVVGTVQGSIELFSWPDTMPVSIAYRARSSAAPLEVDENGSSSRPVSSHGRGTKRPAELPGPYNDGLQTIYPFSTLILGPSPIQCLCATAKGIFGQGGFDVFATTRTGFTFQCFVGKQRDLDARRTQLLSLDEDAKKTTSRSKHASATPRTTAGNPSQELMALGGTRKTSKEERIHTAWKEFQKFCLFNRDTIVQLRNHILKLQLKIETVEMHARFERKALEEIYNAEATALAGKHKAELEAVLDNYTRQVRTLQQKLEDAQEDNIATKQRLESAHHHAQNQLENVNFQLRQEVNSLRAQVEDLEISKDDQAVEYEEEIKASKAEAATELSAKEQTLAENRAETSLKLEEVGHMYEETLHQEIERLQKREKALQEQLRVTKEESHKALKAAEQNLKHKTAEMGRILHRHIKNSLAQDQAENDEDTHSVNSNGKVAGVYRTTQADLDELQQALNSKPKASTTPRNRAASHGHSKLQRYASPASTPTRSSGATDESTASFTNQSSPSALQAAQGSEGYSSLSLTLPRSPSGDARTLRNMLGKLGSPSGRSGTSLASMSENPRAAAEREKLEQKCRKQARQLVKLEEFRIKDQQMREVQLQEKDRQIAKLQEDVAATVLEIESAHAKVQAGEESVREARSRMKIDLQTLRGNAKKSAALAAAGHSFAVRLEQELESILRSLHTTKPTTARARLASLYEEVFDVAHGRGLSAVNTENAASARSKANAAKAIARKLQRQQESDLLVGGSLTADDSRPGSSASHTTDSISGGKQGADQANHAIQDRIPKAGTHRNGVTTTGGNNDAGEASIPITKPMGSKAKRDLQSAIESSQQLKKTRAADAQRTLKLQQCVA